MALSSFFGKKKDKNSAEPKNRSTSDASSAGLRPLDSRIDHRNTPTTTSRALSFQEQAEKARELGRLTTDKIDQIESEMSREMARQASRKAGLSQSMIEKKSTSEAKKGEVGRPLSSRQVTEGATPSVGQSTEILLGDSLLSNAIELSDSISNPAVEESAILYAHGQSAAAIEVLKESIQEHQSNHGNAQAWLMLLELYQASDDRDTFESLVIDYALRFETSAPNWSEEQVDAPAASASASASGADRRAVIAFPAALDAEIVPQLDKIKRLTPKYHTLYIDFSKVTSADGSGAELIQRMFGAFGKSSHELVIQGSANLLDILLDLSAQGGASESIWLLMLHLLRLQERQVEFEDKSIEYCVAFEVSPPVWEHYSENIKIDHVPGNTQIDPTIPMVLTDLPANTVELKGELLGKAENDLALLSNFSENFDRICIDCSRLKRVDFTAAGALLNWAVSANGANKTIEFRRVSHLVAALLIVMGIHEVAQIERR